MIVANISSYIGIDTEAEHYYCSYEDVPNIKHDELPRKYYSGSMFDDNELYRSLSDNQEIAHLNAKEGRHSRYSSGDRTNRFNSIEDIHTRLLELFPESDIITYEDKQIFNNMLYVRDGVNVGRQAFGEVYMPTVRSFWKDLILEGTDVKIKCDHCGKEYTLDEVTEERDIDDRILVKFLNKRDMDEPCCKYFDLTWNVVL